MTDDARFFIVGCGRSGTTLLRLILAGHSRLHIPPESKFVGSLVRELPLTAPLTPAQVDRAVEIAINDNRWAEMGIPAEDFRRWVGALAAPKLADIVNLMYQYQLHAHGKQRCGDKTPDHIQHIPQLMAMYPDAKFIHIIRDGRDVAISYINVGWGRYYDHKGFEWTLAMRRRREYLASPFAERVMEVAYEDLVRDPAGTVRRVCGFLGEEFEPSMLNWQNTLNLVPEWSLSSIHSKLTQPILKDAIALWRQQLSGVECFAMEACLGNDLYQLGYPLRFSSIAWRPLLTLTRGVLWFLAPLLMRGIPYLERRNYLPRKIYV